MPYRAYVFPSRGVSHLCDLLKMSAKKPLVCYKEYTNKASIIVQDNWESRRLAGLYDQAKQGRPPKCTPEQKAHICQWAKDFPKHLNKIGV